MTAAANTLNFNTAAFETFFAGVQKLVEDYRAKNFPTLNKVTFSYDIGSRYIRVVREDGQKSVFCFVDRSNGDVLKAATWKAPAKHARGNINDAQNGLGSIGPYGPAYLR